MQFFIANKFYRYLSYYWQILSAILLVDDFNFFQTHFLSFSILSRYYSFVYVLFKILEIFNIF